jgi:putative permease
MGLYRHRWAIPFSANGDFIQVARLQSYAGSRYFTSNIYLLAQRKRNFDIWKNKKDAKDMLLFSLIGMLFMQYGYFLAIGHSNAATATVLQYLAPVMIVIYVPYDTIKCRLFLNLPLCSAHCWEHSYWQPMEM